ncbi:exosortase B [Ideonella azotifigens]|nr:exosortase B [Ideonella azotifigens]MCD2342047.1 exosortase B [Ideonella azotifigens]
MSSVLSPSRPLRSGQAAWAWGWLALGLAVMYVPALLALARDLWGTDRQGHGPLVLLVAGWLFWRQWPALNAADGRRPALVAGWLLLVAGLLLYVLGRSQSTYVFEIGSLIPMVAACVLLQQGGAGLRTVAFPLFFLLFVVPLPDSWVDLLTQPMKAAVSAVAEWLLRSLGYPIARTGVVLQIGQYQLLVADACAGIQSLFTLEALGLLYLNVVRHSSALRNVALAILVVPVSFTANVVRVAALCLITYHLGDAVGQGFLHQFSGLLLFLTALLLIIAVDSGLRRLSLARGGKQ